MKIGMSTACFFMREDTEKAVMEISRLGVKRCEIFLSGYSEYTERFFGELERIMDGEGMACSAVHALSMQFEPQLFSPHKRQNSDAMDIFSRILDGAGRLQAECYTMHGHFTLKNTDTEPNYGWIGPRLAELSGMAMQRGVRLALENVHYCMFNTSALPIGLEQYAKGSSLGYTLDIKQAVRSGEAPLDYLSRMQGRLANVHICGLSDLSTEAGTCMPEHSVVDNALLARQLHENGYTGPVTLEVYPGDYEHYSQLKDSVEYMESVYNG